MNLKTLLCTIAVLWPSISFAFIESYSLFGTQESNTINTPDQIGSEYYSDILAFRNTINSDFNFFKATNAYDIHLGSLDSKQFAIQQRFKLKQSISEKLFFDLDFL
jgi:hypothetical protein